MTSAVTGPYYAFMRVHDTLAHDNNSHSPWIPVGVATTYGNVAQTDVHRAFNRIAASDWSGKFDSDIPLWQPMRAGLQGEDTNPMLIYDFVYLPQQVASNMTRQQAGRMLNGLTAQFWRSIGCTQEDNRATALMHVMPFDADAYTERGSFMLHLLRDIESNDPADRALLKYHLNPALEPAEPVSRKSEAYTPVSAPAITQPVQPTAVQQHRRRYAAPRLDPHATLLYLRRLRASRSKPAGGHSGDQPA